MRESQLRKVSKCAVCGEGVGHTGLPLFYSLTIEHLGLNVQAIRRQDGLGMMLGSSVLASVMGADEEMTVPLGGPIQVSICETCITERIDIAAIFEGTLEKEEKEKANEH